MVCLRSGRRAGLSIGISRTRGVTALPPGHCQPHHEHHQRDLDDQAEDRGQAAETAEQAAAEQHAEQACAEEAGRKAAHEAAGATEHAAARRRGCRRIHASTGLGVGPVELRGRARRGRGRRRRRIGARTARAGRHAAARAGVSRRDRQGGRQRKRQHDGDRVEEFPGAKRESHVRFPNPRHGDVPLRWADFPKSEDDFGSCGCGPQSRGCGKSPYLTGAWPRWKGNDGYQLPAILRGSFRFFTPSRESTNRLPPLAFNPACPSSPSPRPPTG